MRCFASADCAGQRQPARPGLAGLVVGAALLLTGSSVVLAGQPEDARPEALRGVSFDQHLNDPVPRDAQFLDEQGRPVALGDYLGQQPAILVLGYYRCPMLCNLVLNRLVQGMLGMRFEPGRDYQVITVSFDPKDTPTQAAAKKKAYVRRYGKAGAAAGWHFLTGREENIRKLTEAVGFHYQYDAERDLYVHPAGLVVLTPEGKIARYIFDVRYSSRDLRLALVEASQSKIASPVDQILLYCFHYDPQVGKYTASIMNFVRAGGTLGVLLLILAVWFLSKSRKLKASVVARVHRLGREDGAVGPVGGEP